MFNIQKENQFQGKYTFDYMITQQRLQLSCYNYNQGPCYPDVKTPVLKRLFQEVSLFMICL